MVHGEENFVAAQEASTILFKKGDEAVKSLKTLSDNMFMEIFEGVPQKSIAISRYRIWCFYYRSIVFYVWIFEVQW